MIETAIRIDKLGVTFGAYRALEDVSLTLEAGRFLAVVGPNGGGKSTLLKALIGLIEPTGGHIQIFGRDPRELPPETIGYIPQFKTLNRRFPARAWELVTTGLTRRWPWRRRSERCEKALDAMRRTGVDHLADRPVGQLSGGELQRVYLARSIVRRPRLILLDEPATGMDWTGEADMYAILEREQKATGATVVMITHDVLVARHHADEVLLLNRAPMHYGPPEETLGEIYLRRAWGHVGHRHEHVLHAHPHSLPHENGGGEKPPLA